MGREHVNRCQFFFPMQPTLPKEEKGKVVRRFVGKKTNTTKTVQSGVVKYKAGTVSTSIPEEILNDSELNSAIAILPSNYNFEIHKCIWRLKFKEAHRVALQFPEGLLAYSCIISDILEKFTGVETVIMGDVTYGACCIDDFTARALGCDFLIHYGHSCLIPIQTTMINTLYVFVDIKIDVEHFIETVKFNFPDSTLKLALVGTIQFASSLHIAKSSLATFYSQVVVPQARPLSPGEILGCTSPKLESCDVIIYLADGRFHLESMMISNPNVPAYQYDPFTKLFIRQYYEFSKMLEMRHNSIKMAQKATFVGVILGTLGRQGNTTLLKKIERNLSLKQIKFITVLLSEIFPEKLNLFPVQAWIQIACPRLSIDWGYAFDVPLLNPYEAEVAFGNAVWDDTSYPMDFYSSQGSFRSTTFLLTPSYL
eukprot:TRINITY_DN6573_c0_g1_i4.p1 TRINITY_DN6573_c0_g1~~TRINITY_DN6573_c0_g1_i4.p1  ORF type:complete len:425 (+),score=63.96 TRINITY_DN6573_c0_g1_i4:419-1693(+)